MLFNHLARERGVRWRAESRGLDLAIGINNVERMQRTFDRINASCIGCHSRFRDFAGQLDFQRASAEDPAGPAGSTGGVTQ